MASAAPTAATSRRKFTGSGRTCSGGCARTNASSFARTSVTANACCPRSNPTAPCHRGSLGGAGGSDEVLHVHMEVGVPQEKMKRGLIHKYHVHGPATKKSRACQAVFSGASRPRGLLFAEPKSGWGLVRKRGGPAGTGTGSVGGRSRLRPPL